MLDLVSGDAGIRAGWIPAVVTGAAVAVCCGFLAGTAETAGAGPPKAADVPTVLRRDQVTFLHAFIGLGVAVGLTSGLAGGLTIVSEPVHTDRFSYGLGVGLADLLTVGLTLGFIQAAWDRSHSRDGGWQPQGSCLGG